ncbi:unnamed protein product [Brugia timori]|uniref:Transposase n=1 Tax=Brugia timori TaxID=42155 RepID=A0A0R3QUG0_9BILA|nr:unnamed protein product [Brugia timori]
MSVEIIFEKKKTYLIPAKKYFSLNRSNEVIRQRLHW